MVCLSTEFQTELAFDTLTPARHLSRIERQTMKRIIALTIEHADYSQLLELADDPESLEFHSSSVAASISRQISYERARAAAEREIEAYETAVGTERVWVGRDPERIPLMLAEIQRLWVEDPDLRLGQIVWNAGKNSINYNGYLDLYGIEDDVLLNNLRQGEVGVFSFPTTRVVRTEDTKRRA